MKATKVRVLIILAIISVILTGYCLLTPNKPHARTSAQPQVIMISLDISLQSYELRWQKEIERRFSNAVGILVHGTDDVQGEWIVGTAFAPGHKSNIKDIVETYSKIYPDRTIILLACNTGHLKLDMPGVYYATGSVWCVPDRQLRSNDLEKLRTLNDKKVAPIEPWWDMPKWDSVPRWDIIPNIPALPTPSVSKPESKTRWETDPTAVGNIFEFIESK